MIRNISIAIFLIALVPAAAQAGTCALSAGQVVINEVLPAPSDGASEWVELYNTTPDTINIGDCYIDDVAGGGGSPYRIPAGTTMPGYGRWTLDRTNYFNNTGDDVRLLKTDLTTVLDTYTYTTTNANHAWYRSPDGAAWFGATTLSPTKGTPNQGGAACGTGSWVAGNLEVHHINIGQGDATLIVGPTGRTLLADAGESNWNSNADADVVGPYIQQVLGCKKIDYVVISHFHVDHVGYVNYGGLWHLVNQQGFTVGKMIHRNFNTHIGKRSGTLDNWIAYLASTAGQAKLKPVVAVEGTSQVDLGSGVTFKIVAVDGNGSLRAGDFSADAYPPSENDYSIAAVLRFGQLDYWVGGDFSGQFSTSGFGYSYHDIEVGVADEVKDVDIFRVNHHGSDHSNNAAFIAQLDPEVSIVSVGNANTFGHPRQPVMDRLNATSQVYMTERGDPATNIGNAQVAGHVVVKTVNGVNYTVNGANYVATDPVRNDSDGDNYFIEADPNDGNAAAIPLPSGGCNPAYQTCQ